MDTTKCLICLSEFMDNICPRCRIPRRVYENVIDNPNDDSKTYNISEMLKKGIQRGIIESYNVLGDIQRAKLSHYLHKMFHNIDKKKEYTPEDYNGLRYIIREALDEVENEYGKFNLKMDNNTIFNLPNPMQQLDRLILFLGDNNYIFDNYLPLQLHSIKEIKKMAGYIGINALDTGKNHSIISALFKEAIKEKWITDISDTRRSEFEQNLTVKGYQYYQSLLKNINHSSFGFLAMKFPDYTKAKGAKEDYLPDLTDLTARLQSETMIKDSGGFSIYNPLIDESKVGNITYNMLNHIQNARFLVAELSHHNNGAYWEAGYAFGLGKNVFFMCHENERTKTHFDIAQHNTIFWKEETIEKDCKKLADMIKFHFPEGAVQNTYLQ